MNYIDAFSFLNLNSDTATLRDVKKAYAIALRKVRPEEDRDGFMRLREARSIAEYYLKNKALQDIETTSETCLSDTTTEVNLKSDVVEKTPQTEVEDSRKNIEQHYSKICETLLDENCPEKDRILSGLINAPIGYGIEEHLFLERALRSFIARSTQEYNEETEELNEEIPSWMTKEVFTILDEHYGWSKQSIQEQWINEQNAHILRIKNYFHSLSVFELHRPKTRRARQRSSGARPPSFARTRLQNRISVERIKRQARDARQEQREDMLQGIWGVIVLILTIGGVARLFSGNFQW